MKNFLSLLFKLNEILIYLVFVLLLLLDRFFKMLDDISLRLRFILQHDVNLLFLKIHQFFHGLDVLILFMMVKITRILIYWRLNMLLRRSLVRDHSRFNAWSNYSIVGVTEMIIILLSSKSDDFSVWWIFSVTSDVSWWRQFIVRWRLAQGNSSNTRLDSLVDSWTYISLFNTRISHLSCT